MAHNTHLAFGQEPKSLKINVITIQTLDCSVRGGGGASDVNLRRCRGKRANSDDGTIVSDERVGVKVYVDQI